MINKKRMMRFPTSSALGILPEPAFYVHGSHLCVAHYPKDVANIGIINENTKCKENYFRYSSYIDQK